MTISSGMRAPDGSARSASRTVAAGALTRRAGKGLARTLAVLATIGLAACASRGAPRYSRDAPQQETIRNPDTASRLRVAAAAEAAGQQDVALSMLGAAAAAAPSNLEVQARHAASLGRAGMMEEAEQVLTSALQRSSRDPSLILALGQLRVRMGASAEALTLFDQVLARLPQSVPALNGRGVALDLLGRHSEAQQSYRTAQAVEPANLATANNLAMSLMLDGQASEAVSILSGLSQRAGAPPRVATNLGIAQAASGDAASAQATLGGRVDLEDLGRIVDTLRPAGSAPLRTSGAAVGPSPVSAAGSAQTIAAVPSLSEVSSAAPILRRERLLQPAPNQIVFTPPSLAVEPAAEPAPPRTRTPPAAAEEVAAPAVVTPEVAAPAAVMPAPEPMLAPPMVMAPVDPPAVALDVVATAWFPLAQSPHPAGRAGIAQVQLLAAGSESGAWAEWGRLQSRVPELADLTPAITRFERDGHPTFWRVRTNGFADSAEARAFCAQLRSRAVACWPVNG